MPYRSCPVCVELESKPGPKSPFKLYPLLSLDLTQKCLEEALLLGQSPPPVPLTHLIEQLSAVERTAVCFCGGVVSGRGAMRLLSSSALQVSWMGRVVALMQAFYLPFSARQ